MFIVSLYCKGDTNMKNLLIVLGLLISNLGLNAQSVDLTSRKYKMNDSEIKKSDTLRYDLSTYQAVKIEGLSDFEKYEVFADYFNLGLYSISGNPKTDFGFLIFDVRHYFHKKKIIKKMRKELHGKLALLYNSQYPEKEQERYFFEF